MPISMHTIVTAASEARTFHPWEKQALCIY